MASLEMSPQLFAILSALVEERLGLHYAPSDASILADKLAPRALERGFDSLLDYYYFLRYDAEGAAEMDALADALVVNETYFFRETDQLTTVAEIVAELARDRRPRVWCAAASTGEEPLTLAMLLDQRGLLDRVDLLATDVSTRALARARDGRYRGRALRVLPAEYRERYFHDDGDGVRIDARVHRAVAWRQINLLDEQTIGALGTFDIVLCRNVLIYFRDDLVRRIVARLSERIALGGYLVVGTSESLLRFSAALSCVERSGVFLYRKGEP